MSKLTPEVVAELRKLHEAATAAPWIGWTTEIDGDVHHAVGIEQGDRDSMIGAFALLSDREVARLMRNALPDLLDAAEDRDRSHIAFNAMKGIAEASNESLAVEMRENPRLRSRLSAAERVVGAARCRQEAQEEYVLRPTPGARERLPVARRRVREALTAYDTATSEDQDD